MHTLSRPSSSSTTTTTSVTHTHHPHSADLQGGAAASPTPAPAHLQGGGLVAQDGVDSQQAQQGEVAQQAADVGVGGVIALRLPQPLHAACRPEKGGWGGGDAGMETAGTTGRV